MSDNSTTRWGLPVRLMHGIGMVLILVLILHGWWMSLMISEASQMDHIVWHASFGYVVLLLTVLRMIWRGNISAPQPLQGSHKWERNLAALNHMGMYLLTLGISVQGWALAGTFEQQLEAKLLGFIPMPMIMSGHDLHDPLVEMHSLFAWMLAALILLHIIAAGYHHFHKKDHLLQRMFWSSGK